MAYVAAHNEVAKPSFFAAFAAAIRNGAAAFVEARRIAAEIHALEALSDRQLADIGIRREDIARRVAGV